MSAIIEELRRSITEQKEEGKLKSSEVVQLRGVVDQLKAKVSDVEARLSETGRKLEAALGASRVDRLRLVKRGGEGWGGGAWCITCGQTEVSEEERGGVERRRLVRHVWTD